VLLVLEIAAPLVVRLLGADPAYFELTVTLTRWALLSVLLLGLAGVLTAALYARRDFKWPAGATAAYNAGTIVTALGLAQLWADRPPTESIVALAIGLVVGALLQALVQLPGLRDLPYVPLLDWRHPGVRLALRLYAPVAAGLVVTNVGVGVYLFLAWRAGPEALATLQFATTLVQFPLGLVASAVSLAALPTLARSAEDYQATLTFAMRLVLLLILPATVGLVVLREPVVALLFQRGAFDALATAQTAQAFLFFSPQLPFAALDQLFIVAFYARKDTRTPVLVGVGTVLLYIATAPVLCGCVDAPRLPGLALGRDGLALANAIQNSAHAVVLYLLLRRAFTGLSGAELGAYVLRVGLAAFGMGAVLVLALPALATHLGTALVVTAAGAIGLVVYALLLALLRVREASLLWEQFRARLPRRN
jgi:putative peptidoglycan lipid II flippase